MHLLRAILSFSSPSLLLPGFLFVAGFACRTLPFARFACVACEVAAACALRIPYLPSVLPA